MCGAATIANMLSKKLSEYAPVANVRERELQLALEKLELLEIDLRSMLGVKA